MGQGLRVAWIGCALAFACGATKREETHDTPAAAGAAMGGEQTRAGGNVGARAGSDDTGGGGSQGGGGSHGGGSQGGNVANAGSGGIGGTGVPACPPPIQTTPNPPGCAEVRPLDVACNIDPELLCTYWMATQNVCPQSSLIPTHYRCCEQSWLISNAAPPPTCTTAGVGGSP